jgi:uncharacterized membrane protein YqjE
MPMKRNMMKKTRGIFEKNLLIIAAILVLIVLLIQWHQRWQKYAVVAVEPRCYLLFLIVCHYQIKKPI